MGQLHRVLDRHQHRRRHGARPGRLVRHGLPLARHQPRPQGRPLPRLRRASRAIWPPGKATRSTPTISCLSTCRPTWSGRYYVFVVTDPPIDNPRGKVFEANQRNNDRPSDVPLVIDVPPPTQLQVTAITVPPSATIGDSGRHHLDRDQHRPKPGDRHLVRRRLFLADDLLGHHQSVRRPRPVHGHAQPEAPSRPNSCPASRTRRRCTAIVPPLTPGPITSSSAPTSSTKSSRAPTGPATRAPRRASSTCRGGAAGAGRAFPDDARHQRGAALPGRCAGRSQARSR